MLFIDTHVHYIEDEPDKYISTLLQRMDQHNIEKCVLWHVTSPAQNKNKKNSYNRASW